MICFDRWNEKLWFSSDETFFLIVRNKVLSAKWQRIFLSTSRRYFLEEKVESIEIRSLSIDRTYQLEVFRSIDAELRWTTWENRWSEREDRWEVLCIWTSKNWTSLFVRTPMVEFSKFPESRERKILSTKTNFPRKWKLTLNKLCFERSWKSPMTLG